MRKHNQVGSLDSFHSQDLISNSPSCLLYNAQMLVWRICYWINSPNWYFSLLSSLVCLILYWHRKEKFSLGHKWELKGYSCLTYKDQIFCHLLCLIIFLFVPKQHTHIILTQTITLFILAWIQFSLGSLSLELFYQGGKFQKKLWCCVRGRAHL